MNERTNHCRKHERRFAGKNGLFLYHLILIRRPPTWGDSVAHRCGLQEPANGARRGHPFQNSNFSHFSDQNFQNFPNASQCIRTHPDASECIRTHPNRSEQVRTSPKPSKNVRTLRTTRIFRTNISEIFRMHPNASGCIRMHPNASEQV